MDDEEKELYQALYKLPLADVRNELEQYSLPITGTRTSCIQRLFKYKRRQLSKTSTPRISSSKRVVTRQAARSHAAKLFEKESLPTETEKEIVNVQLSQSHVNKEGKLTETDELTVGKKENVTTEIDQRVEEILEKRLENHLAEWQEKFSQILTETQSATAKTVSGQESPCTHQGVTVVEASTPYKTNELNITNDEIKQLRRKQTFIGSTIEVVMQEIQRLVKVEKFGKQVKKALERMNSLESEYSRIIQELIAILPDEEAVDKEVAKLASFQQEIFHITMIAEQQISSEEEARKQSLQSDSVLNNSRSLSQHLRLPKFRLTEFTGNILHWVSWWDQYKTCIHENEALTDRDRFNYLRMYVKGTAKRAIEFIEVSGDNYSKAIEALQKRYGRKRLIVEHLVESLLDIEVKEEVDARSLRNLYDIMVSRYRTLESYEPKLEEAQRVLVPILQSKLPNEIRRKWEFQLSKLENEEDDLKVTVQYLFDFLRAHVMSEEAAEKSAKPKVLVGKFQGKSRRKDYWRKREKEKEEESDQLAYSATALNSNSRSVNESKTSIELQCVYCGKKHDISGCPEVTKKSVDERLDIIKDKRLCFNCLSPTSPNHYSITCKSPGCSVAGCNKKHHRLLHRGTPLSNKDPPVGKRSTDTEEDEITSRVGIANSYWSTSMENQVMLLPTAVANLVSNGVTLPVRVLIDSGSDQSYIRKEIVDALSLSSDEPAKTMTILMHGGQSRTTKVRRAEFQLSTRHPGKNISLRAWSVPIVCSPPEPTAVNLEHYPHLKGLVLADTSPQNGATIDILIGADQWSLIMKGGIKKGTVSSPMAMNSVFGWLLSGPTGVPNPKSGTTFSHHAATQILSDDPNQILKKFWDLESIGVVDNPKASSVEEECAKRKFYESVKFDGQRYEVSLPWKKNRSKLASNKEIALKRLVTIEARLKKQPEQAEMYKESINRYLVDGHARLITKEDDKASGIHYLPHHPVFRYEKSTTKCRAVFDAATKSQEGITLNDCLLPGPALQPDIVSLLIRFRLHRVAMMADMRKMFLQIKLAPEDQNMHRFFWRNFETDQQPRTYCMTRLPFGDVSSPYEAMATTRYHADRCKDVYPEAAKVIKEDTYVDDCLTGAETDESAFQLYSDLIEMMKIGGFDLAKWATNSKQLLKSIPEKQQATNRVIRLDDGVDPLKALGISWDTIKDVFLFHQGSKLLQSPDPATKRSVISIASKLFDPLGFLSPFTIRAKILYQKLWIQGLSWDECLDEETKKEWWRWKEELEHLGSIQVIRSFLSGLAPEIIDVQLQGYSDASPVAYGAVVYLRLEDCDGAISSRIILAKSRVAPTKRLTLPRLELTAAYLLSRMMKYLLEVLEGKINYYICWTDSMITLSWIRRPSHTWKVFVANRVQAIQENTMPERWRYCSRDSNPADLLTHGKSLKYLIESGFWWHGPGWLREAPEQWPEQVIHEKVLDDSERNSKLVCNVTVSTYLSTCIDFERPERWIKLVRVTAFVFKAVTLFKRPLERSASDTGLVNKEITCAEMDVAKRYWYQEVQRQSFPEELDRLQKKDCLPSKSSLLKLDPFWDESTNLLRVGGRLQFSELPEEMKHQIILPAKHPVVEKIIAHAHEFQACHAGPETTLAILRETFWILRGRRAVKRVLSRCRICRRWRVSPMAQQMAPLPVERVTYSPPFTHVGIDFTGPVILKIRNKTSTKDRQKAYICIFSCATTRMVHLELTNDMTTEEFLQALRRMYNRRGLCATLWSDNQTTFKKADKDIQWLFEVSRQKMNQVWKKLDPSRLQSMTAAKGIKWKFITERSPHRGGWWERICRSIKEPLRKILGKALLTYTEMYTVLTDIEAVINSRPLTTIGNDLNDGQVISPAHLALGRGMKDIPEVPVGLSSTAPVSTRFLYRQSLTNQFWKRWLAEYLPQLTIRQKWLEKKPPLKRGDVVLISEDNVKRAKWPLAVVQELHKGKDELIRTATLRTSSGQRRRPVQKLYLLEEAHNIEEERRYAENCCDKNHNERITSEQVSSNDKDIDRDCQGGEDVRFTRSGRLVKTPERFAC